jgi:hypothetical protein
LRATRAYITGFGTTGLLLAAAFMTLFVMSAYVAFNGFPGQGAENPIGNLVLQEQPAPVSIDAKPAQVHTRAATRSPSSTAQHRRVEAKRSTGPSASTGPVVKHRVSSPAPTSSAPSTSTQTSSATAPVSQKLPSPQLPSGVLPELPQVNLPPVQVQVPVPSQSTTLDTSGVTNAVSNVLGG